jgi:hypothetical protein
VRRSPSSLLLLLGLVGGLVVLSAQPSSACSCGGGYPRDALETADAAFTGSLIRREEPRLENGLLNLGQVVTWTFRVDQPLKGAIGPRIDVESPLDGAACGLEVEVGEEAGLLLWKEGGRWHSNLCAKVDPELLIRASGPLPAADGAGPVRLLVGGSLGEARTIALDSAGRTLAYGFGEGRTGHISVCPGSERVAEVASDYSHPAPADLAIAVRVLPTLTIEWETKIEAPPNHMPRPFSATGLSCRNRAGTDLLVATHFRGRKPYGAIVRFRNGEVGTVYRGPADWVSFAPGNLAYVSGGRKVFAVDLHTGKAKHVPQAPLGTGPFAVSPDGDGLAAVVMPLAPGRRSFSLTCAPARFELPKRPSWSATSWGAR